jgi:hypothetical protein
MLLACVKKKKKKKNRKKGKFRKEVKWINGHEGGEDDDARDNNRDAFALALGHNTTA